MTLTRKAIEEAISDVQDGNENRHNRGCSILIELAQEYLAIKGMPEELIKTGDTETDVRVDVYNRLLHLCRLAHAKNCQECGERAPTIEEINKFLLDWGKENKAFQKNDGFRQKLSEAIHTLITGKMKGEGR
jgi:hypothetical protein